MFTVLWTASMEYSSDGLNNNNNTTNNNDLCSGISDTSDLADTTETTDEPCHECQLSLADAEAEHHNRPRQTLTQDKVGSLSLAQL